jgi:DNA adenine methylase
MASTAQQSRPARPVIRYHGGKYKLAPWILSHLPEHRIYVEPFCGASSVLMAKPRSYAEVINDLNTDVVNLFRVLRDNEKAADLERQLKLTPFARDEFAEAYMPVDADNEIERARRLIIRCFQGFGSAAFNSNHGTGFRSNSNRSGTTPAHDWVNYPSAIDSFVDRLQGVIIENRPAVEIIKQHDSRESLIYCDPPYVHETRKQRQSENYGQFEMSDDDHRKLAEVLHGVRGMVVLSGYPSTLYQELYPDWRRIERAAFGDGASPRTEGLWFNENAVKAGIQQDLF